MALRDFDVSTVQLEGWSGIKNGALLKRIDGRFDVFVTQDKHLPAQNLVSKRRFGVVVLSTKAGRWNQLEVLMPRLRETLAQLKPGTVAIIRG